MERDKIGVGIDLGTTNCCISVWRNGKSEIIYNRNYNTFPSVIAYTHNDRYIGTEAKNQKELNPKNVFYEVKRLIGRKFSDHSVQLDIDLLSYELEESSSGGILIKSDIDNKKFTPEELSGALLNYLKQAIEEYLGYEETNVVITIPAYFNDSQREATKTAARISGLNCIRIINEPTAASLAYGLESKSIYSKDEINVLVCDIGGGTTDISIVCISDGIFSVLASAGNSHLGGSDFDNEIIRFAIEEFMCQNDIDEITEIYPLALQELRNSAERSKKILSKKDKSYISVKNFHDNKDLLVMLTRDKLNELCHDLLMLCTMPIEDVLKSAELDKSDIDEIIMVGGATRMPMIREQITKYFGKEPNVNVNPDEVVAIGASIQAYILQNREDAFSKRVTLLDITPLSLGVEVTGEIMDVVIPRNSNIPTKVTKPYTNDTDYDTAINIKVFEGERQLTKNNFMIGEFELHGIEKAPKGTAVIEITFAIDVNGIITVTAEDKKTDSAKSIRVTGNKNNLSDQKIEELIEEAKRSEEIDKKTTEKRRSLCTLKGLLDALDHSINNDEDNLISKKKKQKAIDYINEMRGTIDKTDFNDIDVATYNKMIKDINLKYETMILNSYSIKKEKGLETVEVVNATTVFNDESDEEFVDFERLKGKQEKKKISDKDRQELYEIRDTLMEQCHEVKNILDNNEFDNITEEDKRSLHTYIEDLFVWIHVKTEVAKGEYESKLRELDIRCNSMFDKYKKTIGESELKRTCETILYYMTEVDDNDDVLLENINRCITDMKNNRDINYEDRVTELEERFNRFYEHSMTNNKATSIEELRNKQKIK